MNAESKCNCQHCNGHIAFPEEMSGQSINRPHCLLETLLFIPPITTTTEPAPLEKKNNNSAGLILAAIILLFIVILVLVAGKAGNQSQPVPSNLKPVVGAFGYKLGDKISGETQDFIPLQDTPPFTSFHIDTIADGRICCVSAMGHTDEIDAYDAKKRLVSVLTEKYGLRYQAPAESNSKSQEYDFGTVEQTAHLRILDGNYFYLDYFDKQLQKIYFDEQAVKMQKDEDDKKAALKKGL